MDDANQFRLLGQRRFLPFFLTQAFGAFNDNLLKNVLIILVTYQAARWSTIPAALLTNIAAGLFIAPFVVFSGLAGQMGERFDKTLVLKSVKALEVAIMLVALKHRSAVATAVFAADFRHPAVLARELASIDQLSEGRLEVGLGAGYQINDYAGSGIVME